MSTLVHYNRPFMVDLGWKETESGMVIPTQIPKISNAEAVHKLVSKKLEIIFSKIASIREEAMKLNQTNPKLFEQMLKNGEIQGSIFHVKDREIRVCWYPAKIQSFEKEFIEKEFIEKKLITTGLDLDQELSKLDTTKIKIYNLLIQEIYMGFKQDGTAFCAILRSENIDYKSMDEITVAKKACNLSFIKSLAWICFKQLNVK